VHFFFSILHDLIGIILSMTEYLYFEQVYQFMLYFRLKFFFEQLSWRGCAQTNKQLKRIKDLLRCGKIFKKIIPFLQKQIVAILLSYLFQLRGHCY
jgi:hypothetical protein